MLNKLHGQPGSYDKKSASLLPLSSLTTAEHGATPSTHPSPFPHVLNSKPAITDRRSQYHFGKTLGAGTYGIVREAEVDGQKVAVKIILKKNVKGNEQMVYDELKMLQKLNHPHIVRFHDWFESRVSKCDTYWAQFHSADTPQDKYYIVTQLATGGELFDRICDQGRFTEKDASQTIKQVLEAVDYLHQRNVVHRGNMSFRLESDPRPR